MDLTPKVHSYTKRLVKTVVSMIVGQYMNLMWVGGGGGGGASGPKALGSDPELTGLVFEGTWRLQSYSSAPNIEVKYIGTNEPALKR